MISIDGAPVSIIGGSVIGLACAFRLAHAGADVTLYAPSASPRDGAGWVAGGMLGGLTEAWPGEETMLHLGVASLDSWEQLLADLAVGGADDIVTGTGTILTGADDADATDIERTFGFVESHYPGRLSRISRREMRQLEPALRRGLRAGILCPEEHAVDNRVLLHRLTEACDRLGVRRVEQMVTDLTDIPGERVVVAAGAGARELLGLDIREVKGEVVRLRRQPGSQPAPARTIRARVHGRPLYLVPRAWGVAVGATEYEHGHDTAPTAGGIRQLLDDAALVFPGIDDYVFDEVIAGLRPYSPDNVPVIGSLGDGRLIAACGHGRNGVLLSAITADAVLAEVRGTPLDITRLTRPDRPTLPGVVHEPVH
ncbi:glycine oxidase ThiO [Corynebacterium sp. CCM 9203]|uniref:glycine oxidase ThiO n=1 Tax=Corynebacterium sp. CCM 9203 TaxID=3057615 RepID=UPI0035244566